MKRQAARIAQSAIVEGGRVDCSIAQITMTLQRQQHAFFSEPYYADALAVLHASGFAAARTGARVARPRCGRRRYASCSIVGGWFPAAAMRYLPAMPDAVAALKRGDVDALFDDDVVLQEYVGDAFDITRLPGPDQYFAVAMGLGSRTLLNMVDRAIRDLRREHTEMPNAFNRKTIAHVGREEEAKKGWARQSDAVPEMDRSIARIRRRGKLRVGIHPGVAGLCTTSGKGRYTGLEPEIARRVAQLIFGDPECVEFVPMAGEQRLERHAIDAAALALCVPQEPRDLLDAARHELVESRHGR